MARRLLERGAFLGSNATQTLTILSTCCEKFWLINLASRARLRGALILLPSSCGGSVAVSLTESMSTMERHQKKGRCVFI